MEKDTTTDFKMRYLNKSKSYSTWINAGYELFAQEGPEGIQIERLARILDLNKSGFYHYFGNHDSYFQHLMQHHLHQVEYLVEKIQTSLNLVPECIQSLTDFSTTILAQKQLQRARHIPLFAKTYADANHKVDSVILPRWADFIELPDNPTLAMRYLELVRDIFYARVTRATMGFEFILETCIEAKEICDGFKNSYSSVIISKQSA